MRNKKKAVMLMSGGVDSSVAAYKLINEGYEVIGLHFKTVEDQIFELIEEKTKVCCSPSDTSDAKYVAKKLGITDFRIVDIKNDFQKIIINYFVNTYKKGLTPNPCIVCNKYFKFGKAVELAKDIGAEVVSSGHYVLKEYSNKYNKYLMKKGIDNYKDQSYFLSMIKESYLDKLYFPLGHLKKEEIRRIAKELNLIVADKPDSQELCFIPDNNYRRFLKQEGLEISEGKVYDLEGNHIGKHSGYINYTIGQRSGIEYFNSPGIRMHVYEINSTENSLIVAPTEKLYKNFLIANSLNMFIRDKEIEGVCRIRKSNEEKEANIIIENNKAKVFFKEDIFAITPGQYAVFYNNEGFILGSGIIES